MRFRDRAKGVETPGLLLPALAILGVLLLAWLIFFRGGGYQVRAELLSASQLVPGNQVRVGGVPIGSVKRVERGDSNLAEAILEIDEDFAPLRRGTTAIVRSPSGASIANRSVNIDPGPESAPEIPDGGRITLQHTRSVVETDQFFDTLDLTTTRRARRVLTAFRDALDGRGRTLNDAFRLLEPATSRTAEAFAEIGRDEPALRRLVRGGSDLVSTLADRSASLTGGTSAALEVADALADEREAIARSLGRFPELLRTTNTTVANLRATLRDVRPAIGEARPAARGLSRLLPILSPAARDLRRTIPSLRLLIRRPGETNDLLELLRDLPPLERAGTPVVRDLVPTLDELLPVLDELRPYVPDLGSGLAAFGGSAFGYYDANGHYARIQFTGGPFTPAGLLSPGAGPAVGARRDIVRRCPGTATYRAPDGSTPFEGNDSNCDPSLQREGP